jgi:hypothetical protein
MAETSIFWATGSTGDGASEYTQAQLVGWLRRTFLKDNTAQGVLPGYANELAVSGASSPLTIATGAALVYGFPYEADASVSLAVPTPSSGTTGHRVVLRANWTAQTVRVALVSSPEGTADIPALTQTPNTTWEISLATLTITTGGVITLADARTFAQINSRLTAKDLMSAIMYRQGDSATDWTDGSGTSVNGLVTERAILQTGSTEITLTSGSSPASATVTFPVAYTSGYTPVMQGYSFDVKAANAQNEFIRSVVARNITNSQFSLTVYHVVTGGPHVLTVYWTFWGVKS